MKNPVRILMLEPSSVDVARASAALHREGVAHELKHVQNGETFTAQLERERPDLILSDYLLPDMTGYAALAFSHQLYPDVPFLFLSGAMGEEAAIESLKRGATDCVLKPNIDRLPPAVLRALAEAQQRGERKQAEEELARKARELVILNADLQQFAYAASHDLQEPLRTISLFSKLLATRYHGAFDSQADEYLAYIESAARHMSALLEDLLLYARIPAQDRDWQPIDLGQLVDETVFLFQAALNETKSSVTRDALPAVACNSAQLGLVFQNLISNALKYRGTKPAQVHITATKKDKLWIFAVQDNGIGFEQAYAEQVFGLFKRLNNRDFPGTGLGLAICKRIVEGYGGRIWAESSPDVGSTFYFSMPARAQTPTGDREPAAVQHSSL